MTGFVSPPTPAVVSSSQVACVGDSITEGSQYADGSYAYPLQLGAMLGPAARVANFGLRRATLLSAGDYPYIAQAEFTRSLDFRPNVVVILLGTNDTKPINWVHRADFESDYEALADRFRRLEPAPRILACLPIPCFFPGQFAIDGIVIEKEVIPRIESVARRAQLELIDLFHPFRGLAHLAPDGVHPNQEGARRIAHLVRAALSRPSAS